LILGLPPGKQNIMAVEHVEEKIVHLTADREQRGKKGLGTRHNLQKHIPSDLLSPTRPCLRKFPVPPKTAPPVGDKAFNS
jgi:hypothetical protein